MYDDPCPKCGHRRKRTLMSTDPDSPGLKGIWNGEAGAHLQILIRVGIIVLAALLLAGAFQIISPS